MAKQSSFKRDYDNGTVTLPDGKVIDIMSIPAESLKIAAIYGFIRQCQDPCGSEKDPQKKKEMILEIAEALIAGTFSKERASSAKSTEEKLEEAKEELEELRERLATYIKMSDEEKRFAAKFGVSRSGIEKEITALGKRIKKLESAE